MTIARSLIGALALAGIAAPAAAQELEARRTFSVPHVLEVTRTLMEQAEPSGLSVGQRRMWIQHTEWLKSVHARLEELALQGGVIEPRDKASGMATGRRTHEPIRFKRELGTLQKTLLEEARKFETLSNVMKTRHDTAMNAIRNMKA